MFYVGLDYHTRRSSLTILDSNGKVVKQKQILGPWPMLLDQIAGLPKPFSICFEASCGYGHLDDQLRRHAQRVVVAHPGQVRMIFRAKTKNDRIDSQKLATLLFLDQVPQVHVPELSIREWRGLVEFRQSLLAQRVRLKNQLRALLRSQGILMPKSLWSNKGLLLLRDQTLSELDSLRRDILMQELQEINQKMLKVEKVLNRIAQEHAGVQQLMSIPGVGPRTAEAFIAYIDRIERFGRIKQIGSYLGLVPCQDSSAERNRLGHITRDGPPTVRKLLCQAAWCVIKRNPGMQRFFTRIQHGKPDRKKIALVATTHRLARVMGSMLRSGETWREE